MKSASEMFLYNCWYAAAWEREIEDGKPFARTFLEKPVVIYRGEKGYVALDDRCCHRAAPLSLGGADGEFAGTVAARIWPAGSEATRTEPCF